MPRLLLAGERRKSSAPSARRDTENAPSSPSWVDLIPLFALLLLLRRPLLQGLGLDTPTGVWQLIVTSLGLVAYLRFGARESLCSPVYYATALTGTVVAWQTAATILTNGPLPAPPVLLALLVQSALVSVAFVPIALRARFEPRRRPRAAVVVMGEFPAAVRLLSQWPAWLSRGGVADPTTPIERFREKGVSAVLVAADAENVPAAFVREMHRERIEVWVLADTDLGPVGTRRAGGIRWRRVPPAGLSRVQRAVKRTFDLCVTIALLPLAAPLAALVALAVRLFTGGPVLYLQTRVGRDGRHFTIIKFRTMQPDSDGRGPWLAHPGDPRITPLGRHLKNLHLDELPQLLNVLRGEMSLVGPRPERPMLTAGFNRTVPRYDERHLMPVGLTGLAQLRGDYSTPAEVKLVHDLRYARQWSIWLDLQLLLGTAVMLAGKLLRRRQRRIELDGTRAVQRAAA